MVWFLLINQEAFYEIIFSAESSIHNEEYTMPVTGESIRLSRLFSDGKNAVIVAVDHGLYFGPLPGMINLPAVINKVAGADAILMAPGMPAHCQQVFSKRGAPACIVRLNWGSNFAAMWNYKHSHSVTMVSVADAVAQGADLVIGSLSLKNPDEAEDARNVEIFSSCVTQKRVLGIPLIGEVYPTGGDDYQPEDLQDNIFIGCRIIAELGADLVKTFYTGKRFNEIIAATPVPVLALGAKKLPKESDALKLAAVSVEAGARGIVFGRNVIQSKDPDRLLDALKEVVKEFQAPDKVAAKYKLD
jgi:DhnA family fructose-bisphosphate aldolase class Ia